MVVEVVFVFGCISGGREGDLERTERGDEERKEGVALRSDRGESQEDDDEYEDGEAAALVLAGPSIWERSLKCTRDGT